MIRLVAIVSCAFLMGACSSTSYKIAPSTEKVTTKLATAARTIQHASKRSESITNKTVTTQTNAVTTGEHIEAALKAIGAKDYTTAAQEMVAAHGSNRLVEELLKQSLEDLKELNGDFVTVANDLRESQLEVEKVKSDISQMALQGAKDRAIVEQGEWGFGAGYFIVGVKRILSHAFWGALILIGVVAVLSGVAFFVGGPLLKGVTWAGSSLWGLITKRRNS